MKILLYEAFDSFNLSCYGFFTIIEETLLVIVKGKSIKRYRLKLLHLKLNENSTERNYCVMCCILFYFIFNFKRNIFKSDLNCTRKKRVKNKIGTFLFFFLSTLHFQELLKDTHVKYDEE